MRVRSSLKFFFGLDSFPEAVACGAMTSMTPERRVRKREQSKSPLNELDDELLPTPDETVGLSASTIADIVRREIRMGISPMEARLTSMETVLGNRVDNIDQQLKNHGDRIEKIEALLESKDATPRSRASEHSFSVEKQIADLQMQIDGLRLSPRPDKLEPAKVMVVGGLATLLDMQSVGNNMGDEYVGFDAGS
ncbi:hypothetical protein AK812_SmicGene25100 [Symbiodinium microadriaticum]|uniref:Uncharacterized protein n=1 Tax=Symbiodinium microadriaticum TaxID=2951 RepID=A0A1Q9DCY6_SYMMI|nr:hypothetical protein AK812_SmicGene25100 [Symbiodinium microadriaticum]